ncbi:hypothetical protein TEQG_03339 [Trichophyton equinum CBS 127.97]|uniref:DUF7053 domain-containing protein n=1 Tax=Trichophyton equinum (strain ATCC MYA-4606 / CBS 127.97) TaxID=559882 RepID=F2PQZ2_TRIEC|nr:hypothetical protein TEQG_03339 [Trichophyton equinum CBS 127.97]
MLASRAVLGLFSLRVVFLCRHSAGLVVIPPGKPPDIRPASVEERKGYKKATAADKAAPDRKPKQPPSIIPIQNITIPVDRCVQPVYSYPVNPARNPTRPASKQDEQAQRLHVRHAAAVVHHPRDGGAHPPRTQRDDQAEPAGHRLQALLAAVPCAARRIPLRLVRADGPRAVSARRPAVRQRLVQGLLPRPARRPADARLRAHRPRHPGEWSVGGNMPGEPRETVELGIPGAPREGLYLREDVNMRCNVLATGFVKKTLRRAHAVLVDRLLLKADIDEQKRMGSETATSISATSPSLASPSLRQQERMAHCSSWANSVEHPLASPQHARGSVAISEIDSGQHPPASLAQGGQNQEQKVFELA